MKCDNCGNEEVNFHYTSSINGNVTERHLCADCAAKLGFQERAVYRTELPLEEVFKMMFGVQPDSRMLRGYGMIFPTFIVPTVGMMVGAGKADGAEETQEPPKTPVNVEIDAEMKKRREINMLRDQMNKAAEAEDFEKAAALRDSIRKLESSELQ
jgi:protein arginine kinase activator